jgi:hypothetical protein
MTESTTKQRTPEQIALAQRTLEQIKAHPQEWDQTTWRCQSGMCFAGWAAVLNGRRWLHPDDPESEIVVATSPEEPGARERDLAWYDGGEPGRMTWGTHVRNAARADLGLTETEAVIMFGSSNELADLEYCVAKIAAGEEVTWDDLDAFRGARERGENGHA